MTMKRVSITVIGSTHDEVIRILNDVEEGYSGLSFSLVVRMLEQRIKQDGQIPMCLFGMDFNKIYREKTYEDNTTAGG